MKNKFFAGLALMVFAFAGAAFTANKSLQSNHYIQGATSCDPIAVTTCSTNAPNPCLHQNVQQVYLQRNPDNPAQCQTPLRRP